MTDLREKVARALLFADGKPYEEMADAAIRVCREYVESVLRREAMAASGFPGNGPCGADKVQNAITRFVFDKAIPAIREDSK